MGHILKSASTLCYRNRTNYTSIGVYMCYILSAVRWPSVVHSPSMYRRASVRPLAAHPTSMYYPLLPCIRLSAHLALFRRPDVCLAASSARPSICSPALVRQPDVHCLRFVHAPVLPPIRRSSAHPPALIYRHNLHKIGVASGAVCMCMCRCTV